MSEIVLPGDDIGVVEEYLGEGFVYEHNGVLRAATVGAVQRDPAKHILKVIRKTRKPSIPAKGDLVYGVVSDAKPKMVIVDVVSMDKNVFQPPFTALLPISMISTERVESADSLFTESDIVVARVESTSPPFILSTKSPEFGVILARCRICGGILESDSKTLFCPNCGVRDKRKLSSNYILKRHGGGSKAGGRLGDTRKDS
ncbi:MAG: exosome complex RNA-binding protein Csl4 [Thermoprotei archaeon]